MTDDIVMFIILVILLIVVIISSFTADALVKRLDFFVVVISVVEGFDLGGVLRVIGHLYELI
jgi:hypothetical protein